MPNQELENIDTLAKAKEVGRGLTLYDGKVMPQNFGQVIEFAQMMSRGGLSIPKHLRDNAGACLRVIQQAMAWQIEVWGVASKTYMVNDILAFEAQLVAAIIKKWAPIREKVIPYKFTGEGGELQCSVTIHHAETGEAIEYTSPKRKDIKPQNSPLWSTDPQQQIAYYTIRALARRHFPEILLGVYDREEVMAMKDITPKSVKNFLEDESAETGGVVTVNGEPLTKDGQALTAGDIPEGTEVVIPPETIAANLLRYIKGETDLDIFTDWLRQSQPDIAALPAALREELEAAIKAKVEELEF